MEDIVVPAGTLLGDPPPARDFGLLGSAAALLQSIVNNHAVIDGNERLGWLATAVNLEWNRTDSSKISNDDVIDFVMWATSNLQEIGAIAGRLKKRLGD